MARSIDARLDDLETKRRPAEIRVAYRWAEDGALHDAPPHEPTARPLTPGEVAALTPDDIVIEYTTDWKEERA